MAGFVAAGWVKRFCREVVGAGRSRGGATGTAESLFRRRRPLLAGRNDRTQGNAIFTEGIPAVECSGRAVRLLVQVKTTACIDLEAEGPMPWPQDGRVRGKGFGEFRG